MPRFAFLVPFALSIPTTATAAELHYEAPEGCPAQSDVQTRLDQRGPDRGPVGLIVRSDDVDGGFLGNVVVGTGPAAVHRELQGRTRQSVIDGAVLVATLARETPRTSVREDGGGDVAKPAASAEEARSSVEVAVGVTATVRELALALDTPTAAGGGVVVEASAPALWAPWYRPSVRLGFQYLAYESNGVSTTSIAYPQNVIVSGGDGYFLGGMLDVCPLGVTPINTRNVDVTFAGCATGNIGDIGALWADLGGLARTQLQIGRKDAVRGFFDLGAGYLGRLTGGGVTAVGATISNPYPGYVAPERSGGMWTVALAGGVVFP